MIGFDPGCDLISAQATEGAMAARRRFFPALSVLKTVLVEIQGVVVQGVVVRRVLDG